MKSSILPEHFQNTKTRMHPSLTDRHGCQAQNTMMIRRVCGSSESLKNPFKGGPEPLEKEINEIRRDTRLSSGTSAGTFAVSAGPYRNYQAEAGTKNEPDTFLVPIQKKGWKIDPHVSNLRSRDFIFRGPGVQVHPQVLFDSELLNQCHRVVSAHRNHVFDPASVFLSTH